MKNNMIKFAAVALASASLALSACSDFDEINEKPMSASALQAKAYYALNQAFKGYMQEPYYGERTWIINWAAYARFNGFDNYAMSIGGYNDEFNGATYGLIANSIKASVVAMNLVDEQLANAATSPVDLAFIPNVRQFARVWRVMTMADFTDCFGPMPTEGFQGVNPEFKSVEEVYAYLFQELSEIVPAIDLSIVPTDDQAKCDPAFGYDAAKWKKFAISLWMRLAMRLSEAAPATAQAEFEKAVAAGSGIETTDEMFAILEAPGSSWDDYTPVYGRGYRLSVSATFANLTTNLGVASEKVLADPGKVLYTNPDVSRYTPYIKEADYLGKRFQDHWELNSDNPTQAFWMDGIPANIDPRAFAYYHLPGDCVNRVNPSYVNNPMRNIAAPAVEYMYDKNSTEGKSEKTRVPNTETNITYAWNGYVDGFVGDDISMTYNGFVWGGSVIKSQGGPYPAMANTIRDNSTRIFFGPWETYFLLAEAALRGWNVGTTAEAAYNKGIEVSLNYWGMGSLYSEYVASETYNRVGTSVKFTHTTEPVATAMKYIDGYSNTEKTWTYEYPKAANTLYARVAKTPALNDQLTKIITQKYIANAPWQALECWSDHRRLGLPFWEIPAMTVVDDNLPAWRLDSYKSAQQPGYFVQRMRYPSSLKNADMLEYYHALELLTGKSFVGSDADIAKAADLANTGVAPIWWAIGGH